MELIYEKESYEIIGAAQEIHRILGPGFLEAVYQEALEIEFEERNIPFIREQELRIQYKGQILHKMYNADFVCYDKIIVETKALSSLNSEHESQVPLGVRGRNSDNKLIYEKLEWKPNRSLFEGLKKTYPWITKQVANSKLKK
jgi:GxxExxY protein